MAKVTPKARIGEELKDLLKYPDQIQPTQEENTGRIPDWVNELWLYM